MSVKTLEELAAIVERLTRLVKQLNLRNILVLALLMVLGLPTYITFWVLRLENRPILNEFIGVTKIVAVVDDCPVVRTQFQGKTVIVTYLNYSEDKMLLKISHQPYSRLDSRAFCEELRRDRVGLKK